jgi:ABC-type antimicrobial peptide transport system permease subunit
MSIEFEAVMNFLFGIIVGIVLTVGTAFIADSFVTASMSTDPTSRQIVNWDVAKERLHDSTTSIRVGWERLERGINNLKL